MAKKIRQVKQVKLKEENINKNSGKDISHTINKIKEHERLYTFLLVIVFMVTICLSIFLGLRVDTYQLYDASLYDASFSMTGQLITLTKENIKSDADGLKSKPYTLHYKNSTGRNINFIIRFSMDEDRVKKCECDSDIISYDKIKYSIDGKTVQNFNDETMIITAGMLKNRKSDDLNIRFWIDDSVSETDPCLYYGKFIFEELEDMDA